MIMRHSPHRGVLAIGAGIAVILGLSVAVFVWHRPEVITERVVIPTHAVVVGGQSFDVAVADEPHERAQGLSGVAQLGEREGMLFVFASADRYAFWMNDMLLDLDFVWIEGGIVRELTTQVSSDPLTQQVSFRPSMPVDMVLELPAGSVHRLGIAVGDVVRLAP